MIFSRFAFVLATIMSVGALAHGATPLETYRPSLDPLIDKAARHQVQFAVDVNRRVDSESAGSWQEDGGKTVWAYSLRIPLSTSMAFHATRLLLPSKGTLTIAGGGQTYTYTARDLRHPDLWSRAVRGDTIQIRISVPNANRHQTRLEIGAFQAGYKSLDVGIPDHPHYAAIKMKAAAAAAGCVENYECHVSAATQDAANASVALVISNKFACSGTLLNDVAQDGAPYVLTARHCENGEDGGGDPAAASSTQIFWNAVSPCGQPLASIFDSSSPTQFGAITVVEQQDQWLMFLEQPPAYPGVYYAGWDAGGAPLVNGYTVDYTGANTQQYVEWSGTAVVEDFTASALSVGYASTYWGVVNSLGSIDHGASGSGLFNGNSQLVGSSSRAVVGQCPANPPPVPTKDTADALFNRLASTFNSKDDASSSTNVTLSQVLDTGNTGATSMTGIAGVKPFADVSVSQQSAQVGTTISILVESSAGATCTATGGASGDGWSGTLNAYPSTTLLVTENAPGVVTYGMTCVNGARSTSAQQKVTWSLAAPTLTFYDGSFPFGLYPGVANPFTWQSNQPSCQAAGGTAGDGWGGALAGSGQANVTENQPGTYSYTITCGTGSQAISQTVTLTFGAPTASIQLVTNSGLRLGQSIFFAWQGSGDCTASGGGSGDGWAGPLAGASGLVTLSEKTAGTYTYKISCGPAAVAATAQFTYTFVNAPPTATLTASQSSVLIDLSVQEVQNLLSWTSNVQPCSVDYTGPVSGSIVSGYPSTGTISSPQQIAGSYTYVLTCGLDAAKITSDATITWQQQATPKVTLSSQDGNEFELSGGYLAWTTNVLPCVGSGGTGGDGFTGTLPYYGGPGNFSAALVQEPQAGTYTFTITCGVGNKATAQAIVVYNNEGGATLTLTPGGTVVVYENQPAVLTWQSAVGPCTGYGGTPGDGWSGSHPQKGTLGVVEPLNFDGNLTLVCGGGAAAVEAQTRVWVYAPATNVSGAIQTSGVTGSIVGYPVTLSWDGEQAASCTAGGGLTGDNWTGTLPYIGSQSVVESQAGPVTYTLTCQNGSLSDTGKLTLQWYPVPSVTLSSSTSSAVLGAPFTLSWTATSSAIQCVAQEDGVTDGQFAGPVDNTGSKPITETTGSQHTYAIFCQSDLGYVNGAITVNFTPQSTASGSSGGGSTSGSSTSSSGHGGGGEVDAAMLALATFLALTRIARRGMRRKANC